MPQLRNIECPGCGDVRQSKAGAGTRLRCSACGKIFRASALAADPVTPVVHTPDDSTSPSQDGTTTATKGGAAPAAEHEPAGSPPPAGGGGSGGVKVTRATKTVVPQTARPRPRATTKGPAKKTAANKTPAKKQAPKPEPTPPTPAAVSGRRGGLGYYAARVRRG